MDASKRMVNLFFAGTTLMTWVIFTKFYAMIFATFGARDAHLLGKGFTLSTLLAAFTALALLFWVWRHPKYRPLSFEVADELIKVTWPDWDETRNHARLTIVVTLGISLILWIFDQVFGNLSNIVLGGA